MATAASAVVGYANTGVANASCAALGIVAARHTFAIGKITNVSQRVAIGLGGTGRTAGVSGFHARVELAGASRRAVSVYSALNARAGGKFTDKVTGTIGVARTHGPIAAGIVRKAFQANIAVFVDEAINTGSRREIAK